MSNKLVDLDITRAKLFGSLLLFTQTFYPIRTGNEFKLSFPAANESHFITICRGFTRAQRLETSRLMINCPPGWAKSELCIHFVAWCLARYPDSKFLYISHSGDLATEHASTIKNIIQLPAFRKLFNVELDSSTKAKDHFKTTKGGAVAAFGSKGAIVGHDAGLPQMQRFTGAAIIDDIHKPDEVHSENERNRVIRNYEQTVETRLRGENVPLIFIGHRLHVEDLPSRFKNGEDGQKWDVIEIEAEDVHGNPRYPEKDSKEKLIYLKQYKPYVYWSQYMQNPQSPGDNLFRDQDFVLLENDPEIIETFITCDTAETDKDWNDATVFSFWGLYKIKQFNVQTEIYGLHWLACEELRIEPKYLRDEFLNFYANCMRYKVQPKLAAIEKKSTGVTLLSVLRDMQGLQIIDMERTRASGSKTARFIEMQEPISSKRISLPKFGRHTEKCIKHCTAITANNTHAHDDIADTLYDAIKMALIDKIVLRRTTTEASNKFAHKIGRDMRTINRLKSERTWK